MFITYFHYAKIRSCCVCTYSIFDFPVPLLPRPSLPSRVYLAQYCILIFSNIGFHNIDRIFDWYSKNENIRLYNLFSIWRSPTSIISNFYLLLILLILLIYQLNLPETKWKIGEMENGVSKYYYTYVHVLHFEKKVRTRRKWRQDK